MLNPNFNLYQQVVDKIWQDIWLQMLTAPFSGVIEIEREYILDKDKVLFVLSPITIKSTEY